eukprot:4913704-Pyramimonas_sp.AAC.1
MSVSPAGPKVGRFEDLLLGELVAPPLLVVAVVRALSIDGGELPVLTFHHFFSRFLAGATAVAHAGPNARAGHDPGDCDPHRRLDDDGAAADADAHQPLLQVHHRGAAERGEGAPQAEPADQGAAGRAGEEGRPQPVGHVGGNQ